MNPPPTMTAAAADRSLIHERMRRESGMLRTANTPGRSTPGNDGRMGAAPGDKTSASYRSIRLSPECTSRAVILRAARSIATISVSVCTALTRLAEKGVPDWVIRAQFGHVSPALMAVYSHVQRKALNEAAQALEPDPMPSHTLKSAPEERAERVTSHVTSHAAPTRSKVINFPRKFGSSGWTRTSHPPVNRMQQVVYLVDSSRL